MTDDPEQLARRHVRRGFLTLTAFLLLGGLLEALHGFKVAWYVAPAAETRRLLWTLAHAHGTLAGLLHLAFAAAVAHLEAGRARRVASVGLTLGGLLLPLGFFLGGLVVWGGDPGLGVALVPPGAALLLAGCAAATLAVKR